MMDVNWFYIGFWLSMGATAGLFVAYLVICCILGLIKAFSGPGPNDWL